MGGVTEGTLRYCIHCGEQIHPKRVQILPHTKTCVKCSTEKPKSAHIRTLGEGDHTCNEIEIIDNDK